MREKLAVVTGANRGMGLETVRQLAGLDYRVILTSRDRDKGLAATHPLQAQALKVDYHQLDVDDPNSIQALADHIRASYPKLDVLVNNAGILPEALTATDVSIFSAQADIILQTFRTNTLGPLLLAQALVPLMGQEGCIVNVSSGMGQLSEMNGGYAAYRLSKTALNALTRILADELRGTHIKVNSVCPGWVRTDMGGPSATRSLAQGVETTIWLATLPVEGPTGGFFRDKCAISW